jgi:hypothetical protein
MPGEKHAGLQVSQLDLEKRYDIYHCVPHEERLYENVKLVGLRSMREQAERLSGIGSFLEIETLFGSRMFISTYGIHLICEHGTKPMFKVFRSWVQDP